MDLVARTFTIEAATLPTVAEIEKEIVTDKMNYLTDLYSDLNKKEDFEARWKRSGETHKIRHEYTKNQFPILSHEFLLTVKAMTIELGFKEIHELCCGTGWLTYWLRKYGVMVAEAIDDNSWDGACFNERLAFVEKKDAIKHIKNTPNAGLYILSWPDYNEETAHDIWRAMRTGQHLLYIGEGDGGCTGDDAFHKAIENKEVKDRWGMDSAFISFWGIHDRPTLLKK